MRRIFATGAFLSMTATAAALSFNGGVPLDPSAGTGFAEAVVFAERVQNAGRLHATWIGRTDSGAQAVLYRREAGTAGLSNFASAVTVATAGTGVSLTAPDLFVDENGTAHLVWVESAIGAQAIRYATVSGGSTVGNRRTITPSGNTQAAWPQVVARRWSTSGQPVPLVVYIGPDPFSNPADTEVLALSGPNGTWTGPANLTNDALSDETEVRLDAVSGLGAPGLVQAAIVYEQGGRIMGMLSTNNTATQLNFSSPVMLVSGVSGSTPALAVQSISGAPAGFVGHVAYRASSGGNTEIRYLQFARLPGPDVVVQSITVEGQVSGAAAPSISLLPDVGVAERFTRSAAIGWTLNGTLRVRRNVGGLSSAFGIPGSLPISAFADSGFAGNGAISDGPDSLAAVVYEGSPRVRAITTESDTRVVLYNESGLPIPVTPTPSATPTVVPTTAPSPTVPTQSPTPTPGGTASPTPTSAVTATASPTPSPTVIIIGTPTPLRSPTGTPLLTPSPTIPPTVLPTASPTPGGPTPTRTPEVIGAVTVIDTLLGFRRFPTADEFAAGDRNGDGVWDSADIRAFLAGR